MINKKTNLLQNGMNKTFINKFEKHITILSKIHLK